jgi:flagellar biosynthetic protein FliR
MIEIPILTIIAGALTIGIRLSGLMLFAPFFGGMVIPAQVKAILVLALTILLYPAVGHDIASRPLMEWPLLILAEFTIGAGMGIVTNLIFEAVQLSGQVIGIQMGYSLVNILDPQSRSIRR